MKKRFAILTALLMLLMITLIACKKEGSGLSGDNIDVKAVTTTKAITLKYTFPTNENIKKGTAKLSVKYYLVTADETDNDDYKGYKDLDFLSKSVITSYELTFSNLDSATEYRFELYLTYDGDTSVLRNDKFKTSSNNTEDDAIVIKNADDFLNNIQQEGYYTLENDIDFDGATVTLPFNSANKFKGTFDGNGKTISNFVLESNTDVGLFRFTDGATIKNLTIDNATVSAARSGFDGGILIGEAVKTKVENVTINNSNMTVECDIASTAYRLGGLVGFANGGLFENNHINEFNLKLTKSSLNVMCGLYIGSIEGEALQKQGEEDTSIVANSSVEGKIVSALNYETATQGYNYVGGFIGNVGTTSRIKDCYTDNEIIISKYTNSTTSSYNNFTLAVGGFAGTNARGSASIDIENCLAITSMELHAGTIDEDAAIVADYSDVKISKNSVNVAGFIGYVFKPFNKIYQSYVYFKSEIIANMLVDTDYSKASSFSQDETYYKLVGDDYVEQTDVTEANFSNYYYPEINTAAFSDEKNYYTLSDENTDEKTLSKANITEFDDGVTYYILVKASSYNSVDTYYETADDGLTYTLATVSEDTFSNYYVKGTKKIYVVDFARSQDDTKIMECETSKDSSTFENLNSDIKAYLTENYLNN